MRPLALLHRWTGGMVGLLLAAIGLSGTALVWEESWIGLPGAHDAPLRNPAALGDAVAAAMAQDPTLSRITFAGEGMGLHQAIYANGGGAYFNQAGVMVDRWDSAWGRPELWLFDLHHYLFLGESGKYLTGALGLLLIAFAVSGLMLWWRTRRTFRFRLWPARMTRGAIIRQHRDIGVVAAPLLLLSATTGVLMIFPALSAALTVPWAGGGSEAPNLPSDIAAPVASTDWRRVMSGAEAAFPKAAPRRLVLPARPGEPLVLRMKQPFEWTPNGRTYVWLDPMHGRVLAVRNPAAADTASAINEKLYPIQAAKVGGMLWKLALTFSGLALVLLGTLATWSFWFRNPVRSGVRHAMRQVVTHPAE
jgi:uncharacterized iron-regulated membrane protein